MIKYKNFILRPTETGRWDLYKIVTKRKMVNNNDNRRSPSGKEYESEQIVAFDINFETAAKRIVQFLSIEEIQDKNDVTIGEYCEIFVKCKDELIKELNEKFKIELK